MTTKKTLTALLAGALAFGMAGCKREPIKYSKQDFAKMSSMHIELPLYGDVLMEDSDNDGLIDIITDNKNVLYPIEKKVIFIASGYENETKYTPDKYTIKMPRDFRNKVSLMFQNWKEVGYDSARLNGWAEEKK
ncbi:MAG: hypothetical protein KKE23_01120 [Nanoarchaeota archaeon]|nr:hypothetical protein [Nanoarchaeota archaeon]